MITDLLSGNFNILSKIVLSGSSQVNTRDVEPEEIFDSLPLISSISSPDSFGGGRDPASGGSIALWTRVLSAEDRAVPF